MNNTVIAFDKSSARSYDVEGRMHVAKTHISKANVNPYYGREIPNAADLGLDPNKIYRLYRDPEELAKGASTFNNLPLLRRHIYVNADEPSKDDVVGSIGSDTVFEHPYLDSSLCIWDAEAIAAVEAGAMEELSSAYRFKAIMESGTSPEGEAFDGRMVDILGNHLALVESGRAGSDVIVADSTPFKKEVTAMKKTALGNALLVALSAASPKIAQDSALPKLVGGATKRNFNKKEVVAKICAMDEDFSPEKVDEIVDAMLGVEQNPEPMEPKNALDENDGGAPSKHAEIIDYLKSKGLDSSDLEAVGNMLTRMDRPYAEDSDKVDAAEVDKKVETAMDALSKELKEQFKALEAAKSEVRKIVGDVIGMDSAEDVYRFTLDHMKVDHKGMPSAGLRHLFAVASEKKAEAPRATIAADSKTIADAVPGLDRFGTA